ncbi:hypothetical protein Taro_043650 [Colocasia esculenta]|uniref:F-box protein n=1 Tax=Colocasia esculenta TaxID=4460 RepID=A0A843WJY3_COLES|nr:hypothetical protein [Colocasia esculenta]
MPPSPPPWEVVVLLSHRLDPKTLALASCVSRSWSAVMSSDDLWRPICHSHFPSLSSLLLHSSASFTSRSPYRSLFCFLRSASPRRRRDPPLPRLALSQLTFSVDVFHGETPVLSVVKRGCALKHAGSENLIFRFDMGKGAREVLEVEPEAAKLRAVWGVVVEGAAAVLVDCRGKGRVMGAGSEVWFSEELPPPACCSGAAAKGQLVAELGMRLGPCEGARAGGEEGKARRRVMGVKVGLMSMASWRYVRVDDGLRYLQHFFPC